LLFTAKTQRAQRFLILSWRTWRLRGYRLFTIRLVPCFIKGTFQFNILDQHINPVARVDSHIFVDDGLQHFTFDSQAMLAQFLGQTLLVR
jgi:hypothetical protein